MFVVSDRRQPVAAQLKLSVLDFNGRLLEPTAPIEVGSLKSKSYLICAATTLLEGRERKAVFVFAELIVAAERSAQIVTFSSHSRI